MPLFGSKHKHDTAGNGVDRHHLMNTNNPTMANPSTTNNHGHTTALGRNVGQRDYAASDTVPHNQNFSTGHPQGLSDTNAPFIGAGGPTNTGGAYRDDARIPPTGVINHGQPTPSGGTGQRLTGKVESAIGSMVGSNALKAKGLEKEQEANSFKLQSRELAEAERLEHEALMRRERAVAHGAHPSNSALGAGRAGTGISGPTGGPDTGF